MDRFADPLSSAPAHKAGHHESQLHEMLERISDGYFDMNAEGTITFVNSRAAQVFSATKEELLYQNYWGLFPDQVGTVFFEQFHRALCEQVAVHFEAYLASVKVWTEVSAYPSQRGLSVFFRDVTERKKTEEELQRLSLIARETDNIIIITDAQGSIVWVNNAFVQKTGYTREEAAGQHPGSLLRGVGSDPAISRYMSEQIRQGKPFQVEILNYNKAKEAYWVEIFAQPIYNKAGALEQYFAIQTDITERKCLQEQLLEEQRSRQKLFTASIIKAQETVRAKVGLELHDGVGQVLTTVKLYLELCRDGVVSRELMDKCVSLVQESIQEIRRLSRRLSAPMLGNIQLKDSVLEIVNTVAAFNKFAITLEAAAIQDLEAAKELHLAVYRILQEHLNNILKHAGARNVQVVFDIEEQQLTLRVSDNGKGFDTTRKRKGLGITNMITRAENVNGVLSVESKPGAGCVLTARFPLVV